MSLWNQFDDESSVPKYLSEDQRKNAIYVSAAEALDPDTRAKGIKSPGWWLYSTHTDSAGNIRHKAELIVTASNSGYSVGTTRPNDAGLTSPQSYVINVVDPAIANVYEGAAASFAVTATISAGGGALSYQWQVAAANAKTFANVSNGGVYAGATTNTLAISSTTGLIGKKYRCIVSATNADAVTTKVGTIEAIAPFYISFTSEPVSKTVTAPAAVSFAVAVEISTGGGALSYKWQENNVDITDAGVYSGSATNTLAISDSTGLTGKTYKCVVTATHATTATSTPVTLTVE